MDICRWITKEDFLSLAPVSTGGTLLGGRRYATAATGALKPETQLEHLGELDKTGEGIIDRVFFFEMLRDSSGQDIICQLVSAKIVERYRFVCDQDCEKELALVQAKIKLYNKRKKEEK